MNAKISLPELIDQLSRKSDCTKKEAEQFLKEFFSLAADTVSRGENLKINGLGQFRSVWVEPRASVNVRTGEPMEIPGHYKLSFSPDKAMREAVNAPFSCFIPEVLPDDVLTDEAVQADENETADEAEDILFIGDSQQVVAETATEETPGATVAGEAADAGAGCGQQPEVEPAAVAEVAEEQVAGDEPASAHSSHETLMGDAATVGDDAAGDADEESVAKLSEEELNALADFVLEKIVAESMPDSASRREAPQAAEETASASMSDTSEATAPEKAGGAPSIISFGGDEEEPAGESVEKCNNEIPTAGAEEYDEDVYDDCRPSLWDKMQQRPLLTGLCAVLLLLLIVVGGTLWQMHRRGITLADAWSYYFPSAPVAIPSDTLVTPYPVETATIVDSAEKANILPLTVVTEDETEPLGDTLHVQALPPLAVHRLSDGDRLTLLALEFYGSKDFWVYIYEENKTIMPNPNRLPVGLEVKIPDPRKYDIDAGSQRSVDKAKNFADQLNRRFE